MNKFLTGVRRIIYLVLGKLDKYVTRHTNKIVVLCYHSVGDGNWRFSVKSKEFKKQIQFMLQNYKAVTLVDIVDFVGENSILPEFSFALTFDDGYKDVYKLKNFLSTYGIKPTLFLTSSFKGPNYLNEKEIGDLTKTGWEIGFHGNSHKILTKLNGSELEREVERSEGRSFSYPHGKYSQEVIETVKISGYQYAVSMDDGLISKNTNIFAIPRVGVDGTHSFSEFKVLASPSVMWFRNLIKKLPLGRFFLI